MFFGSDEPEVDQYDYSERVLEKGATRSNRKEIGLIMGGHKTRNPKSEPKKTRAQTRNTRTRKTRTLIRVPTHGTRNYYG